MASSTKARTVVSALHQAVGQRIRQVRNQRDVDQLVVARFAGYKGANAISQIEHGMMNTTLTKLFAIAEILEVAPVRFFLSEEETVVLEVSERSHAQDAAVMALYRAVAVLAPERIQLLTTLAQSMRECVIP